MGPIFPHNYKQAGCVARKNGSVEMLPWVLVQMAFYLILGNPPM